MQIEQIITSLGSFVLGGGLVTLVTLGSKKKKADVEVRVDEIAALHNLIETVYEPTIDFQKKRIQELEDKVSSLTRQLDEAVKSFDERIATERVEHQKEMDLMNRRILEITSALGMRAAAQLRDDKGRYIKREE